MRGPSWRKFSAGGEKTLFRLPAGVAVPPRVVVCEAAIDALSLAALEVPRADTLYTATAGGMGPATIAALHHILAALAGEQSAMIVAATDADKAGRHHGYIQPVVQNYGLINFASTRRINLTSVLEALSTD